MTVAPAPKILPAVRLTFLHVLLVFVSLQALGARAGDAAPVWTADINEIRNLAGAVAGARPVRINVVTVAESRRTKNFAVKGAPVEPSVQARTAYQVVFADGTVMIDTGMDQQVHRFFGRGVEEPYFPEAAKRAEQALLGARTIFVTHEHGDHAAGVVKTPLFAQLAPKTVLTRAQVQTLLTSPQMPELRLTPEMAERFKVIDYEKYFPAAPGMVLIKAPGHTAGSQMIYVTLQSGREYLFAGDVAWHMDGVRLLKGKDAPWVKEPDDLMMAELTWLNALSTNEKNLAIVISHDDEQRQRYIETGLLGDKLQ